MTKKKFDYEVADMLERKRLQDRGIIPTPFQELSEAFKKGKEEKARMKGKIKKVKVRHIKEGYVISHPLLDTATASERMKYSGRWLVLMVEREVDRPDRVMLLELESFGRMVKKKTKQFLADRRLSLSQDVKVVHYGTLRKVEQWKWKEKFF